MNFQAIISKIADLASAADAAGNNAVAIELDDILMRSSELVAAPLPVEAVVSPSPVAVATASGDVHISTHDEAVAACRDGLATHQDFVSAASQKAYMQKDIKAMANLKAKNSFPAAVSYLITK